MSSEYLDILILGIIAAVLVYRLGKTLGTRFEDEGREKNKSNIVQFPGKIEAAFLKEEAEKEKSAQEEGERDPLKAVFYDMRKVDKNFSEEKFLTGAKKAFEMIVEAFNKGDTETLKNLVDEKILNKFTAAIEGYKARGEKIEQTLVGFKEAKILNASLTGTEAKITVEFETEQAKVVTDANGAVIEGDAVMISTVIDIWEFKRDLKAKSPNWLLISAKGGS